MASKEFKLTSPAISNDGRGTLPRQCTQEGLGTKWNISPPLEWQNVPEKAKTLAVVVQNVDAVDPSGHLVPQTHWVVVNIPATLGGLPEGFSGKEDDPEVMSEEFSGIEQGLNDWKVNVWRGPKWPNYEDRIEFKIYALDNDMRFDNTVTKEKLLDAIAGHVVGEAQFMATFSSAP
ncbi:hypothetical protein L6164_002358 [Bauhinia variegata]|uniref:Uncharacterized protein n=1 Tax=Bauhinia variegata TaxID=167791 RepID=A0ACB9Q3F6_BAUVA|nr:hypothetical protein L6164_002358 [Bauhinia variegata]